MIAWLERWAESLRRKSIEVRVATVRKHLETAQLELARLGFLRNETDKLQVELRRAIRTAQFRLNAWHSSLNSVKADTPTKDTPDAA